jgi:hypothetical protein
VDFREGGKLAEFYAILKLVIILLDCKFLEIVNNSSSEEYVLLASANGRTLALLRIMTMILRIGVLEIHA